ncbi:DUF4864 domain-containing protein [Alphaproteobacteria bacterium GH1-50]|uniref:DUF4864 domain-containing protein n=1 Tax=Kangsaoukella pontilimi TaxID=2691042 RepID=A0A7C9II48_9RHOB|nr:DUF4864 domain-containing protein [Kangsaoukella pontilimi]MXQ09109.1 DUF4864 domain-containing protein [Kangsaoukella pontilimi]
MKAMFLGFFLSIGLSLQAYAQEALPSEPAIEGTISDQIDAFLADDFDRAFTFASPNIQSLFGSPDRFGAMVRQGYPMVWRPGDVTFLALREINGRLWQRVMIRDREGRVHMLDYQMIDADGRWRINGVQIVPAPDAGV